MRSQTYPHWELCICNDGTSDVEVRSYLDELARSERIHVVHRAENGGISAATNGLLHLRPVISWLFLDQDDLIDSEALAEIAVAFDSDSATDLVYTDEGQD